MNENIINPKDILCQAQNEVRSFFRACRDFCIDVVDAKGSPWGPNAYPVQHFIKKGQDKLGKNQRLTLKFLHERYFRWGKPCYLLTKNLAKQVGIDSQANMSHTISSLVERGLIIRIHFMYRECNRMLLLPSLPRIRCVIQKILTKAQNHIPPSVILFQNLPESLRKQSAFIYNNIQMLSYIIRNKIKLSTNKLLRSLNAAKRRIEKTGASLLSILKGKIMQKTPAYQKLVLKRKPDLTLINPVDREILNKLKANGYDHRKLTIDERKVLVALFDFKYNIELNKLLRYIQLDYKYSNYVEDTNKRYTQVSSNLNVFRMAMELLDGGIYLDYKLTDRILTFWNNKIETTKKHNFAKIKIDPKSKTYTMALIALTHTLYYKTDSADKIENAINTLISAGQELRWRYHPDKHIPFNFVFVDKLRNQKKFDSLFSCESCDQFITDSHYITNGHLSAFDNKVVPMIINHLFNGNQLEGEKYIRFTRHKLLSWFHKLSEEFHPETSRRITCGLKLIGKNEKYGMAPLIEEYFHYITTRKSFVPLPEAIRDSWWESFYTTVIRSEFGFEDFWKFDISKKKV